MDFVFDNLGQSITRNVSKDLLDTQLMVNLQDLLNLRCSATVNSAQVATGGSHLKWALLRFNFCELVYR